jgi:hypothetical protein
MGCSTTINLDSEMRREERQRCLHDPLHSHVIPLVCSLTHRIESVEAEDTYGISEI